MTTLIHNVTELQNMNLDLAGDYELANDIDASGFAFVPIGSIWASPFTGTLDGKNYKITGLTITVSGIAIRTGALIGYNQGTIKNLGLESCAISITSTDINAYAGGFAVENEGTIENCYVTGTILAHGHGTAGWTSVGGIADWNDGTILKCYSTATITADCSHRGVAGGIVEENTSGIIDQCYSTGAVIAIGGATKFAHAGGLCHNNYGTINNSYSRSSVSATAGGSNYAAGFIQENDGGNITDCYSTGVPIGVTGIGGFCQDNTTIPGTITDCFWDTQTSGTAVSDGGTGKTTAEMKALSTFSGWNIILSGTNSNNGYPYLSGTTPIWNIYATYVTSPRATKPIEDKITLQLIRNVEMSAHGRAFVDKEGKFHYDSRYGRNPC